AAAIDEQRLLRLVRTEHEIRCCALHAVERIADRTGIPPHRLDSWLWNLGQRPEIKARPRHRCRTVFY
ncbi:MAG: queuosine salvage family protein, partial [Solirubrobacteraceae bacterium]